MKLLTANEMAELADFGHDPLVSYFVSFLIGSCAMNLISSLPTIRKTSVHYLDTSVK